MYKSIIREKNKQRQWEKLIILKKQSEKVSRVLLVFAV